METKDHLGEASQNKILYAIFVIVLTNLDGVRYEKVLFANNLAGYPGHTVVYPDHFFDNYTPLSGKYNEWQTRNDQRVDQLGVEYHFKIRA
jgi:hypothetical protein